ncbi:MAG: response regulator transcription factor [Actinobacteria bacterium]|nr:response regulator transcription factor [Actinomycetota bacterium]
MSEVGEIATVVVCHGDDATLEVLCEQLVADHFEVLPAPSGADALRLCRFSGPDILILELSLPDMAGIEVLQEVREAEGTDPRIDPSLPVVVLLDGKDGGGLVRSRELGADDHLSRPFAYGDLRTRIATVLRRRHNRHDAPVRVGELVIDPGRRMVTVGGREIHLSRKEFTLLRVLATDPTRVFGKDELLRDVWGPNAPPGRTRTLDSHASRLRRKLDPDHRAYVVNCWGIGYRLVEG